MKFRVGDRIIITNRPEWANDIVSIGMKGYVTSLVSLSDMIWVKFENKKTPIYSDWATVNNIGVQLMFNFMYK